MRLLWSIIELSAAFLGKNGYDKIITMSQNERQQSVTNCWSCILQNLTAMECRQPTMNSSAACIGKDGSDDNACASFNWAPTERKQFCGGFECCTAMNCIVLFLNGVLRGQSSQSHLVYNFTNMHAMSYWSDCFTCSSRVNIYDAAVYFAVSLLSTVFRVRLPSCLIPTAILDSKSLNISLLEVMIASENERVFIRDVRDLTLQIIFDAWWALIDADLKGPIAWKNSRHAPWWWFHLHSGIEETGNPGIICIMCHQVLRHPSELGTSSMGKHVLAKAHIAKLNKLTESEVTELSSLMVDGTTLAILKRQGSRGITIVSSQRKIIFDIQVDPYWPKWQTKRSKLGDKDFEIFDSC